jgi:hypothetical protein
MIEFEIITDYYEFIEPSDEVMAKYEEVVAANPKKYISAPRPTQVSHSVIECMTKMVNEGWNIHTFSKDKNNVYYALMEREVPDDGQN